MKTELFNPHSSISGFVQPFLKTQHNNKTLIFNQESEIMKRIAIFFPVLLVLSFLFCCNKAKNPDKRLLKEQFSQNLINGYELKSFKIENQKNIGTDIEPVYKSEITATIVLSGSDVNERKNNTKARLPEKLRSTTVQVLAISRLVGNVWETEFERAGSDSGGLMINVNNVDNTKNFEGAISDDCESEECKILNRFVKFYNDRDIERLFSLLSDSLIIDDNLDKNGFRKEIKMDFALNNKFKITQIHQSNDTVFCDFELYSDFNSLLGIEKIHYDRSSFIFRNNLIVEMKLTPGQGDMRKLRLSFQEVVKWAELHQYKKLSSVKKNEQPVLTAETAQDWLSLIKLWNQNKKKGSNSIISHVESPILDELITKIDRGEYDDVHSVLIQLHGDLVCECYFHGCTRNTLHYLASVNKVIHSALIGIAIDQKKIYSIYDNVLDFFSEYTDIKNLDTWKKKITIKDLLTMSSGIKWDADDIEFTKMIDSDDWIKYMLDLPMQHQPEFYFRYNSGHRILIDGIIQKCTGLNARDYAVQNLLIPLGITNFEWKIIKPNNMAKSGGDFRFRPIDLVKFGQLYLNDGRWNGKQIISKEWIQLSTAHHIQINKRDSYGFRWWKYNDDHPAGKLLKENDIFVARGSEGQFIWIVPNLELVAVSTGRNDGKGEAMFWDSILPFVMNFNKN